jgi:hypothetical protein
MGKIVTRRELYDLLWSEPMTKLAEKFGISGVALAKACDRMCVPVPPRGYWARKTAGKGVVRATLPKRPPGLDDETMVGGGPYWRYNMRAHPSDDELLGPVPLEPTFDEPIEEVRERVQASVRKLTVPKALDRPHPAVAKLLKEDDARREKSRSLSYVSSWDAPRYDSPIQRRRLRLLSALFLATASCGCRAETWGSAPWNGPMNEFSVQVGDQRVRLRAAVVEVRIRTGKGQEARTAIEQIIRIIMNPAEREEAGERVWVDGDKRLEDQLREIAIAIIVYGEEQHRASVLHRHRWRIQARAELIDRRQKEREEAERKERERLAKLEHDRVERLLSEADALRKAIAIRQYVSDARQANACLPEPISENEITAWAEWALAVADGIDPVRSGAFRRMWKTGED